MTPTEATLHSCFRKKSVLKIYSKFKGGHPCRIVISIKLLLGHSVLTFALRGRGRVGPSKCERMRTMGEVEVVSVRTFTNNYF